MKPNMSFALRRVRRISVKHVLKALLLVISMVVPTVPQLHLLQATHDAATSYATYPHGEVYNQLLACSSSKLQLMRAAEYYFQHLGCSTPVILLSDNPSSQEGQLSSATVRPKSPLAAAPQWTQTDTPTDSSQHSAVYDGMGDEELDSLLTGGSTDDFDIEALQQSSVVRDTLKDATSKVCNNANLLHQFWLICAQVQA